MKTKENFFFNTLKDFVPEMLRYILAAIIAFVILRTDVASLTRRVESLESTAATRDLVTIQFENIDKKLDTLENHIESFGQKLDRHLEK